MMEIKLDYDCVDKIVQQTLIETYVNLKFDIKNANELTFEEDLKLWEDTVAAIEVLGKWFFYDFEAQIEEYKKSKKKGKKK